MKYVVHKFNKEFSHCLEELFAIDITNRNTNSRLQQQYNSGISGISSIKDQPVVEESAEKQEI
ncbi:MAG: hypothetical protein ACMG6E_08365 [Candidatus Roizmanbacteria bacterium]